MIKVLDFLLGEDKDVRQTDSLITLRRLQILLIVIFGFCCSGILFYMYDIRIVTELSSDRRDFSAQIFDNIATSPYRYRVLIPWLTQGLHRYFDFEYLIVDRLTSFLSLFLSTMAVGLYTWLFDKKVIISLFAMTIVGYSWSTTFRFHGYQPWSYLEPFFLVLMIYCVRTGKPFWFSFLGIVAVLNRETATLMSLLALSRIFPFSRRSFILWSGASSLPVLCYLVLRLSLGNTGHIHSFKWILERNLESIDLAIRVLWQYYGVFWPLVLYTLAKMRSDLGALSFVIVSVLFIVLFGLWTETRMLNSVSALIALNVGLILGGLRWVRRTVTNGPYPQA
jgi:hypothetical protein